MEMLKYLVLYAYEQRAAPWYPAIGHYGIIEHDEPLFAVHLYGRNVGRAGVAAVVTAAGCGLSVYANSTL